MLLTDWVFSQQPLVVRRLIELLLKPESLKLLIATRTRLGHQANITLPEGAGRKQFVEGLKDALGEAERRDYRRHLAVALCQNTAPSERIDWWLSREPKDAAERWVWWSLGADLEILDDLDPALATRLMAEHGDVAVHHFVLTKRPWLTHDCDESLKSTLEMSLDGVINFGFHPGSQLTVLKSIGILTYFSASIPYQSTPAVDDMRLSDVADYYYREPILASQIDLAPEDDQLRADLLLLSHSFDELTQRTLSELRSSVTSWSEIVEPLRARFGERFAIRRLAIAAAGAKQPSQITTSFSLFDESIAICLRTHAARRRGIAWWKRCVDAAVKPVDLEFALSLVFSWGTLRVTEELAQHLSTRLQQLPGEQWRSLFSSLAHRTPTWRRDTIRKDRPEFAPGSIGPRAAALLALRSTQPRRLALHKSCLADAGSEDLNVRKLAAEILIERAHRAPTAWRPAINAVHALYPHTNIDDHWFMRGYGDYSRSRLPISIARSIANEIENYPLEVLIVADNVLTAHAGRTVPKVGEIAISEMWDA